MTFGKVLGIIMIIASIGIFVFSIYSTLTYHETTKNVDCFDIFNNKIDNVTCTQEPLSTSDLIFNGIFCTLISLFCGFLGYSIFLIDEVYSK